MLLSSGSTLRWTKPKVHKLIMQHCIKIPRTNISVTSSWHSAQDSETVIRKQTRRETDSYKAQHCRTAFIQRSTYSIHFSRGTAETKPDLWTRDRSRKLNKSVQFNNKENFFFLKITIIIKHISNNSDLGNACSIETHVQVTRNLMHSGNYTGGFHQF